MVIWSDPAKADLKRIHDYIAKDSRFYAKKVMYEILEDVNALEQFPQIGRVVPEIGDDNLREIIVGNYRVIYEVATSTVTIQTVLHGARAFPPDLGD